MLFRSIAAASALATAMILGPRRTSADAEAAEQKAAAAQTQLAQSRKSPNSGLRPLFSRPQTITVPEGTVLPVRLTHSLSTAKNSSGETFTATLDEPLTSNGKQWAPAGSEVEGVLTEVVDSGRVKGLARMTMTLRRIELNGKWWDISTAPRSFQAESTKKRDTGIIAGSAAVGAAIGAIAGGGKGAAIGAGVGGGSGTGVVLATKGKPVEFVSEARIPFALNEPVQVPGMTAVNN